MVVLRVPLIRQKLNSKNCGIICSFMVLNYKGYKITLKELLKKMKAKDNFLPRGPLLVKLLERFGVDVKLLLYAPHIFKSLSLKEIKKVSKKFRGKFEGKYAKELLEIKNKVEMKKIDTEFIVNFLERDIPVITSVNSPILRGKAYGKVFLHYIVIIGYKNNYFLINDPHPLYGGKLKVDRDTLIASIYSRKIPEMLVIK